MEIIDNVVVLGKSDFPNIFDRFAAVWISSESSQESSGRYFGLSIARDHRVENFMEAVYGLPARKDWNEIHFGRSRNIRRLYTG